MDMSLINHLFTPGFRIFLHGTHRLSEILIVLFVKFKEINVSYVVTWRNNRCKWNKREILFLKDCVLKFKYFNYFILKVIHWLKEKIILYFFPESYIRLGYYSANFLFHSDFPVVFDFNLAAVEILVLQR